MGYKGVMIWALDLDDFNGHVTGENYPLLSTIYSEVHAGLVVFEEIHEANRCQIFSVLLEKTVVCCGIQMGWK